MSRIPKSVDALQDIFETVAEQAALSSGFRQRRSKLSGSTFVQALVFGWLSDPQASLSNLAQAAACAGTPISPQALDQRFTPAGAALLEAVLRQAVPQILGALHLQSEASGQPGSQSLTQFTAAICGFDRVLVQDSTTIALPDELASLWPGGSGKAALKVQVRWELCRGYLEAPLFVPGRCHDDRAAQDHAPPQAGELHISDLGYFNLSRLATLVRAQAFFLSRLKVGTSVHGLGTQILGLRDGPALSQWLAGVPQEQTFVDCAVTLGNRASRSVACRLLAVRVSPAISAQRRARLEHQARRKAQAVSAERLALAGWTILVTNAPVERLEIGAALALYRARWQIECLFRVWKETLGLTRWRSTNPWRILCEVYAKLIACLLTQELSALGVWKQPQRSLHKAAQVVRHHALHLLCQLKRKTLFKTALKHLAQTMEKACRVETRRKKPAHFQILAQPLLTLA